MPAGTSPSEATRRTISESLKARPGIAPEERFWAKVERSEGEGCWLWAGALARGYGVFWVRGRLVKAHRFAYELLVGPIPAGLTLDHLCRRRACVNPAHLEPVTRGVNALRGATVTAANANKTHCDRGHPLAGANLYVYPDGARKCRACRAADQRRYAARKRVA